MERIKILKILAPSIIFNLIIHLFIQKEFQAISFAFSTLLIFVIIYIINQNSHTWSISVPGTTFCYVFLIILFLCPLILLLPFDKSIFLLTLKNLVINLFPGFSILFSIFLVKSFKKIVFIFSYPISMLFNGFFQFLMISFQIPTKISLILYISLNYIINIIIFIEFLNKRKVLLSHQVLKLNRENLISLLLSISYFFSTILFLYPEFSMIMGSDIYRHYSASVMLSRSFNTYNSTVAYFFHHLNQSLFYSFTNSNFVNFEFSLVIINFYYIIAWNRFIFYFTKNSKLSAIFTIGIVFLNAFLGGFSSYLAFLEFLIDKYDSRLIIINGVGKHTQNSTFYTIFGYWYIPLFTNIIFLILFCLTFYLNEEDISKPMKYVMQSCLVFLMYIIHVSEAVFIILFISIYNLSKPRKIPEKEVRNKSVQTLIRDPIIWGAISSFLFYVILDLSSIFRTTFLSFDYIIALIFPMVFYVFSKLLSSTGKYQNYIIKIQYFFKEKIKIKHILSIFWGIFSFLIIGKLYFGFRLYLKGINPPNPFPIYDYMLLGQNIIIFVITIIFLTREKELNGRYKIGIILFLFAFFFGRIIGFVNKYSIGVSYYEKRILYFGTFSIIFFLSIFLKKFLKLDNLSWKLRENRKKIYFWNFLIIVLCLSNYYIIPINIEYWDTLSSKEEYIGNELAYEALSSYKEIVDEDPFSWLITFSKESYNIFSLAGNVEKTSFPNVYLELDNLELINRYLFRNNYVSHPYVILTEEDKEMIKEKYPESLFYQYIQLFEKIELNSFVELYNITKTSYSTNNGKICAITSTDSNDINMNHGLIFPSVNLLNYTIKEMDDVSINNSDVFIFSESDIIEVNNFTNFDNWQIEGNGEYSENSILCSNTCKILTPYKINKFYLSFSLDVKNLEINISKQFKIMFNDKIQYNYPTISISFEPDGYIYLEDGLRSKVNSSISYLLNNNLECLLTCEDNEIALKIDNFTYQSFLFPQINGFNFELYQMNNTLLSINNITGNYCNALGENFSSYLQSSSKDIVVFDTRGIGTIARDIFNISQKEDSKQEINSIEVGNGKEILLNNSKINFSYNEIDSNIIDPVDVLLSITLNLNESHVISNYPIILQRYVNKTTYYYINLSPFSLNQTNFSLIKELYWEIYRILHLELKKSSSYLSNVDVLNQNTNYALLKQLSIEAAKIKTEYSRLQNVQCDIQYLNGTQSTYFLSDLIIEGAHEINNVTNFEMVLFSLKYVNFYQFELNKELNIDLKDNFKIICLPETKERALVHIDSIKIILSNNSSIQCYSPEIIAHNISFDSYYSNYLNENDERSDTAIRFTIYLSSKFYYISNIEKESGENKEKLFDYEKLFNDIYSYRIPIVIFGILLILYIGIKKLKNDEEIENEK